MSNYTISLVILLITFCAACLLVLIAVLTGVCIRTYFVSLEIYMRSMTEEEDSSETELTVGIGSDVNVH